MSTSNHKEPYVTSEVTGESCTREYVHLFLSEYNELMAKTLGGPPIPQEPLYTVKAREFGKLYIGRAATLSSSANPNELLWVTRIDIGNAIKRLTVAQRQVLGRRYLLRETDKQISAAFQMGLSTVTAMASAALDAIARDLDGLNE